MTVEAATEDDAQPARVQVDGRRGRRDRNRDAVVDALLTLYHDGVLEPSADAIAEQAGLSARSLFRYFDDLDDLQRAAVERHAARIRPLLALDLDPGAPLQSRVDALIAQRLTIFAAMGLIGVVARMRAPLQPPVATQLGAVREALRDHVVVLVEPERARLGQSLADQVVASLDVLCSYESYHLMRYDQGLSQDEATAAMTTGVIRLLA